VARITISLPYELKALLERHAQENETTVSEAVQIALKNHLSSSPTPTAPMPPAEGFARIHQLEDHVAALTYELEHIRQGLVQTAHYFKQHVGRLLPCPRETHAPPWPHTPPRGWGENYPDKYLP
jgi:hypothetical protein